MNTHRKLTFGIATFAVVATTASILLSAGCSNSTTAEPTPTHDSGTDTATADSGKEGGGKEGDSGKDAARDAPADVLLVDTGSCVSETSTCNSCYTDAQAQADPYNTCSTYTAACVPFDPTRVPDGGVGPLN
jgi:hypothetical protein